MKSCFACLLVLLCSFQAQAIESAYRAALNSAHQRFADLEVQRCDYRKLKPSLPQLQEQERLHLLGRLITEDPVWAFAQQIKSDMWALTSFRMLTPEEAVILENFKELLAITSIVEGKAVTRAQAEGFAIALRQFAARGDAAGAGKWALLQ